MTSLSTPDLEPPALPRRICIVAVHNLLLSRNGAAEYLCALVQILRRREVSVSLIVMETLSDDQLRVAAGAHDHYAAMFDSISLRGVLRMGGYFYHASAAGLLRRAFRRFVQRQRSTRRWLRTPHRHALVWAAKMVRHSNPDLLMANYFNAAHVFGYVPDRVPRLILLHDVLALRAHSFALAQKKPDFDLAIVADEENILSRGGRMLAINPTEANYVAAHFATARVGIVTVPVDVPDYPLDGPRDAVVLFVGMYFEANIDALHWLLTDIWPRVIAAVPHARLRIVGSVARYDSIQWPQGAEAVGFVDDLEAEYRGAALAVVPLRIGSGVKIKLVEALAHGLPVVATPVGAEGVEGVAQTIISVASDATVFAERVVELLVADDIIARRKDAREIAKARFSYEAIGFELERQLREAMSS